MHTTSICLWIGALLAAAGWTGEGPGAGSAASAATAVNALGIDLLSKGTPTNANALLSPYSIQLALAMASAGASGQTLAEMERVLHYSGQESGMHPSFGALQRALEEIHRRTAERAAKSKEWGGPSDPIVVTTANRLFGQGGFAFSAPYLDFLKTTYRAPLEVVDFKSAPDAVGLRINGWVAEQTRDRIRDLLPPGALNRDMRLVLVNAIYLKAPWSVPFESRDTAPCPFRLANGAVVRVPTLYRAGQFGYQVRDGYRAVTIPYGNAELEFLVLLPDQPGGLPALERRLTPGFLTAARKTESAYLRLYLPKLRLQPPALRLGTVLRSLGMRSAFNDPPGSADFSRMAPKTAGEALCISEVVHKTFLELDEQGTEAAAATAVMMAPTSAAGGRPQPIEVRVDRPFLFAIQERESGACLFVGRVVDPR